MNMLEIYIAMWMIATFLMMIFVFLHRKTLTYFSRQYWWHIWKPWKIVTFFVAMIGLSAISLIANDPTWDIPESIIMVTLTFLTAPWVVGVIYRAVFWYERKGIVIYIAIVLWLFSASWSYDLYVWMWQWVYPVSWFGNLMISPILYLCGGMFWSLEWREWTEIVFAFREKHWLVDNIPTQQFWKIFPYMMPFVLIGIMIFGSFLYVNM